MKGSWCRYLSIISLALAFALGGGLGTCAHGAPFRVLIDPGHGGSDHGARHENWREADVTLSVSRTLHELLVRQRGIQAQITRKSDEFLSLEERAGLARQHLADLFVSIHVNWSKNAHSQGTEIYFQNQLPADEESLYLASRENQSSQQLRWEERAVVRWRDRLKPDVFAIVEDLARSRRIHASADFAIQLKRTWRFKEPSHRVTVLQAPFFVISNVDAPAVLIELGYLSNPIEGPRLMQSDRQQRMAELIRDGIIQYKEAMDKLTVPRL